MKKYYLLLLLIIAIVIASCEKDDICTDNLLTPKLILRFYNKADSTLTKDISSLYVWAEGKDSIFSNITTDSIALPLNSLDSQTIYYFSNGLTSNKLLIRYTPEEEFISRSCGFRIIFNDVSFSISELTWIDSISPLNLTTVNNQNLAHVKIFH